MKDNIHPLGGWTRGVSKCDLVFVTLSGSMNSFLQSLAAQSTPISSKQFPTDTLFKATKLSVWEGAYRSKYGTVFHEAAMRLAAARQCCKMEQDVQKELIRRWQKFAHFAFSRVSPPALPLLLLFELPILSSSPSSHEASKGAPTFLSTRPTVMSQRQ